MTEDQERPALPEHTIALLDGLRYDANGLIPAVAQEAATGEVLMLAYMNRASIEESLRGGRVVYWSRSRQNFWRKGDSSGHIQKLIEMRVDCDQDSILLLVEQIGPACHTNRRNCFYTALREEGPVVIAEPIA
ncbi:MAG: phosphoribosyl-AMP cyclohydrolase [Neomegalonema sp.]|nr:phosphoribosyl-AMP cyclohydrolase [Neomegalonema sp.]